MSNSAIHKINLTAGDGQETVEIPTDAHILSVGEQAGTISVWYVTNPENYEKVQATFKVIGTGEHIYDENFLMLHDYLGTVVMNDGVFVWHVFKEKTP